MVCGWGDTMKSCWTIITTNHMICSFKDPVVPLSNWTADMKVETEIPSNASECIQTNAPQKKGESSWKAFMNSFHENPADIIVDKYVNVYLFSVSSAISLFHTNIWSWSMDWWCSCIWFHAKCKLQNWWIMNNAWNSSHLTNSDESKGSPMVWKGNDRYLLTLIHSISSTTRQWGHICNVQIRQRLFKP